jgi:hypothetical protein
MTTQRNELEAWLGADWTPEQTDQIIDDYQQWERANPNVGDDDAQAMLAAIAQHHDGVLDIAELSDADLRAQTAANKARRALKAAAIVRHRLAGIPEAAAAREARVDRMTMRKWLGKR